MPWEIVGHGPDRYGEMRFRCQVCQRTFREPAHEGGGQRAFRSYMVLEAVVAVLGHQERIADVAARLFVSRRQVSRWRRRERPLTEHYPYARRGDRPAWHVCLNEGRWHRRVGSPKRAPYVVDGRDLHRYQKASDGELRYWLLAEGLRSEEELRSWDHVVGDPFRPPIQRDTAVDEARRHLLEARPLLAKKPSG